MAAFTKQAIKASFLKLLGMYPLRDISVKMIVEDCGINRKSFYYHYQDIPALLEEILTEQADALLASYQSVHSHPISDANRELIIGFYRGESFGLIMDWMMRGMPDDVLTYFHQICVFRHGMSEEMLTRMVQSDK